MTPLQMVKFKSGTAVGAAQLTTRKADNKGGAVTLHADYEKQIVIVERPGNPRPLVHVPMGEVAALDPVPVKPVLPAKPPVKP